MAKDRKDRLPWFRFHVDRYLLDCLEEGFDLETEGLYLRLLCYQWRRGSLDMITDEIGGTSRLDLAQVSRKSRVDRRKLSRIWSRSLSKKFVLTDEGYVNLRLAEERQQRERFEVMAEDRARKGGEASVKSRSFKLTKEIKNKDKDKDIPAILENRINRQDLKVVVRMAKAVRIIGSNGFPDFKNKPKLWTRWLAEARLLREKDERDPKITLSLIAGLASGEFRKSDKFDWANQIKHPGKLRKENGAGETYWEVLNNERRQNTGSSRVTAPERSKFRRIRSRESKS